MDLDDLTCQELVELVTDYLDGALSDADRARFEAHLAECEPCERHLDQIRMTIATLGRVGDDDVPAPARDELMAAFRDFRRSRGIFVL